MSELNSTIAKVTERVIEKSRDSRQSYLDLMDREADRNSFALKVTHHKHQGAPNISSVAANMVGTKSEPNGNSVVLESEIMNSVDAKRQHDRALAIYRASLGMLRNTLSKQ